MKNVNPTTLFVVVVMLTIMPALGIDLQLPAMPAIGRDFRASVAEVQLTLSLYTIVFAVMQLLFGALGDRFGRRRLLIGAMALYALASLYCALAPSLDHLLAARALQAFAACAGPVLSRAVIRDFHGPSGAGRVLGSVMAWFGIAAIVVPVLGGQLVEAFGWRATYGAAAAFGLGLAVMVTTLLPETHSVQDRTADFGTLIRNYLTMLRARQVVVTALIGCLVQASFFSWIAGSSFAVINALGESPSVYSVGYAVTILGFVTASFASGRLAGRLGPRGLMTLGTIIAVTGAVLGVVLNLTLTPSLATLVPPMIVVAVGHGLAYAQSMGCAMAAYPRLAGTASALFGFVQFGTATLAVLANGALYDGTVLPVLIVSLSASTLAALCLALFRRYLVVADA